MSRRSTNFPPGIWQARRDYGRYRSNINDSNHANSLPSHSHSFESSSRGRDPIPLSPAGEAVLARILDDIGSPPEAPTIVRLITHSRARHPQPNSRPTEQLETATPRSEGSSRLTSEEQNMAISKLKKKIYNPNPNANPTPNNIARRISFYYRENNRSNSNRKEIEEDGKKSCTVCLEDFEPKEEVMITPCNHMFHEDCIVPWVKSHGQCPVCRFVLFERRETRVSSNNNSNNIGNVNMGNDDDDDDDIMTIIRAMEEALIIRNLAGFWGA